MTRSFPLFATPEILRNEIHHTHPSFEERPLLTAQSLALKIPEAPLLLRELETAFERSFMNYTPEKPNHWRDPDNLWNGSPDLPRCGSCVCLCFITADLIAGTQAHRNIIQQYHEFLAAVLPVLSPDELPFALCSCAAAGIMNRSEKHYPVLCNALAEKIKKSSPDVVVTALNLKHMLESSTWNRFHLLPELPLECQTTRAGHFYHLLRSIGTIQ